MTRAVLLRAAEVCYVLVAASLAATGVVRGSGLPLVAAIVLTLPSGIAATVLVYGGYAALKGVGGLLISPVHADGSDAAWLTAAGGTLDVVLFTAAAVANVLLLERARTARSTRRAPSGALR